MNLAVDKCATAGLAAIGVCNSNHYGRAGVYALLAAERGYIGLSTTAVWRPGVVPTFGTEPMFALIRLPSPRQTKRNPPFWPRHGHEYRRDCKIKLAALHQKRFAPAGQPTTAANR